VKTKLNELFVTILQQQQEVVLLLNRIKNSNNNKLTRILLELKRENYIIEF